MALALLAVLFAVPDWPRFSIFRPESGRVYAAADKESQNIAGSIPSTEHLNVQADAALAQLSETRRYSKTNTTELPRPRPSDATQAESLAPDAQGTWSGRLMSWPALLAAAQGLTAILVGAWLIVGAMQSRRLCRRAFPAPTFVYQTLQQMAIRQERLPRVLLSPDVSNPVTLGVRHSTILLPANFATSYDPQSLRSALAHELAHVRHGDLRLLLLGRGLLLLLAVHPFFRRLWRIIRDDQETLADAAAGAENRPQYAAELVKWARQAVGHPNTGLAAALGIWESHSQLSRRIVMLLDENYNIETRCSRKWRYRSFAAIAGAMFVLSLATVRPLPSTRAAASEQGAQPATTVESKEESKKPAEALTSYTGRVIDNLSGKPIAGAQVTVQREKTKSGKHTTLEDTKHITDVEGKYTFTLTPEQVALSGLYLNFIVEHPDYCRHYEGYSYWMILRDAKAGDRPFFEKTELEPADKITGTIEMPDGKPAADVMVKAYSQPNKEHTSNYWFDVKTDQDGHFEAKTVKGGIGVFWIIPKDFSPSSHILTEKHGNLGRFVLEKGIVLEGSLLDENGKPVPDAWVNANLKSGPAKKSWDMPVYDYLSRSALSDAQGRFTLAPLPEGTYGLGIDNEPSDALADKSKSCEVEPTFLRQEVILSPSEDQKPIEITAVPHVVVEAQFFDSSGKRTSSYPPHLFGQFGSSSYYREAKMDDNGKATFKAPKGLDRATLDVITNLHTAIRHRTGKDSPLQNGQTIRLGTLQNDIKDIEIIKYNSPVVIIRAADQDGKPISTSKPQIVYTEGRYSQDQSHPANFKGDAFFQRQSDGRWATSELLPDEDFTLTVEVQGYEPKTEKLNLPEGAIKELEMRLKKKP
jgi:beta-lactamase regulating signal transducer with metallopeptidase domain/5-hydroxyisourate hydrolase-like protein (transthyretin family)